MPKGQAMDDIAMPYLEEGCMGGIYRSVRLESRGDVGIEEVWTQSNVGKDLKHADVKIQFLLCPQTPKAEELTVKCTLKQPDGGTNSYCRTRKSLSPGRGGRPSNWRWPSTTRSFGIPGNKENRIST